eukprot:365291-Chlamydomonas_euryale.AAC.20
MDCRLPAVGTAPAWQWTSGGGTRTAAAVVAVAVAAAATPVAAEAAPPAPPPTAAAPAALAVRARVAAEAHTAAARVRRPPLPPPPPRSLLASCAPGLAARPAARPAAAAAAALSRVPVPSATRSTAPQPTSAAAAAPGTCPRCHRRAMLCTLPVALGPTTARGRWVRTAREGDRRMGPAGLLAAAALPRASGRGGGAPGLPAAVGYSQGTLPAPAADMSGRKSRGRLGFQMEAMSEQGSARGFQMGGSHELPGRCAGISDGRKP